MATNKHATIRYHALDKCFSNFGRRYFIEDLVNACNDALYEFTGIEDGVKKRQVFDDITFMESTQGWEMPLVRMKDGRRVYYRYEDKTFSIRNRGLNPTEAEQLKETLSILSRFQGMPQFEWIEQMQIRLENTFKLKSSTESVVGFEQNPFLKGLHHFSALFQAIQKQVPLQIEYKGYRQTTSTSFVFHPWYLKQYNNRWFVFGLNDQYRNLSNHALDRIISLQECSAKFIPNEEVDFEEFFEDVIGVTVNQHEQLETIILKITSDLWPYIESKPIHGSQKVKSKGESVIIELKLQVNHELFALLFSSMEGIEIIEPTTLREKFKTKVELILKNYL
jgi:predicted DNA-binding transcriptional regulator YafY